jgi:hypothetical protein
MVADQFSIGTLDYRKFNKWVKDHNWTSPLDILFNPGVTRQAEALTSVGPMVIGKRVADVVESATGNKKLADHIRGATEDLQENMGRAPPGTQLQKFLWAIREAPTKKGGIKGLPVIDGSGGYHEIPVENWEE